MRRLRSLFLASSAALGAAVAASSLAGISGGCYPAAGEGVDPPAFNFYYPVGFAVSKGGNVLYAVNSDFDLQWNGGTIQSLDLHLIRRHTVLAIRDPNDPNLPLAQPPDFDASCPAGPPVITGVNDAGVVPGWACAPPTNASFYMRDSVAVGAFATDLQRSVISVACDSSNPSSAMCSRIFTPVRGDASLTWADVQDDDPTVGPLTSDTPQTYAPFNLQCGIRDADGHCDRIHHTGNDVTQPGDTRGVAMPGEPFGMAQSEQGEAIVLTHQTDALLNVNGTTTSVPESSLFSTFTIDAPLPPPTTRSTLMPAIQFVLGGVPTGGIGIAAIPHDLKAYDPCFDETTNPPTSPGCLAVFPRPAFLQTSRASAEVALIRYYNDIGDNGPSALFRPFIQNEADYTLNVNAGTTDFARGIAIDPSPRIRCEAKYPAKNRSDIEACAQLPARVFIASRGPASLIIGEVGEPITPGGSFDADLAIFTDTIPLPVGPSAVHLAPVIDTNGNYSLRVFVVCFDSNEIIDYDPDQKLIEAVIHVGLGPFALTFDPFDFNDVALNKPVPVGTRDADLALKQYRFAYVGSFTQSYMQVIDLDNSTADKSTWGTVVYTVGLPTSPKGS